MTDKAADAVKQLVEKVATDERAGLRISQTPDASLALTRVEDSLPGDTVIEEQGARVFLDEGAAVVLGDKILDANVEPDGSVQFAVDVQA